MKYTLAVEIKKPIQEVIEKFDNSDNMFKWMPGLIAFEHLSGTSSEVGAKSKLVFENGKRKVELIETITHKNLPHEFFGTYETKGVFNKIEVRFKEIDASTTLYESTQEFNFTGFMKLMSFIMPSSLFKKESMKYIDGFKKFAESNS